MLNQLERAGIGFFVRVLLDDDEKSTFVTIISGTLAVCRIRVEYATVYHLIRISAEYLIAASKIPDSSIQIKATTVLIK